MSCFVFRNATLEAFFPRGETTFSGYGDISRIPEDVECYRWFYTLPPEIAPADAHALVEDFLQQLRLVLPQIPAGKPLELTRLAEPENAPLVLADSRVRDAVRFYNAALEKTASERPATLLLPAPSFGVDWRLWFLAQMPFSPAKKQAESKPPVVPVLRKKCLVLDCDDTLWGGTLGEDGPGALKIGGDFPGNVFAYFQKKCVELAESGIILAICSKNNEADVRDVFENHPAMILRRKHISAWRVNWNDKAQNLREIAAELNIGLDSLVFVDNEARERTRVAEAFGGVLATPEFPARAHDAGIAEEHAVTLAAGLAIAGRKPVCAVYSTFFQRAFDAFYHDIVLPQLPVIIALDRCGIVPDGPTHHGIYDLGFLRQHRHCHYTVRCRRPDHCHLSYFLQLLCFSAQQSQMSCSV